MALSASTDFTANRTEIIAASLRIVNALEAGEAPSAEEASDANMALNMMLKSWMAEGLFITARRRVTLQLEKSKSKYTLSTSGDYACYSENLNETAMRIAGVASDTTLEVDSTTGMTAGDYITIVMDDGNLHKTTIDTVTDSDTVVITDALTEAAAVDNVIRWFTTKIARPQKVMQAFVRDSSDLDTIISLVSQQEYWNLSNKTSDGRVNQIYYDAQYSAGYLYVWPESDSVVTTLEMIVQKPFDDMDAATNNVELPVEWLNAIKFNLALMLAYEYGVPAGMLDRIERRALMEKSMLLNYDREEGSVFLQPIRHG